MKKFVRITSILALIVCALVLVGCDSVDSKHYDADFAALETEYKDKTVTTSENLNLPATGENGSTITWVSDNPTYISNAGEILLDGIQVAADGSMSAASAKLTGTVTNGTFTGEVSFTVQVTLSSDAQTVIKAYKALLAEYEGKALSGYTYEFVEGKAVPNLYLDFATRGDCTVTYADSTHIDFTYNETRKQWVGLVTAPTDKDATDEVSVTIVSGNVSKVVSVPILIPVDTTNYVTLADVLVALKAGADTYKDVVYAFTGTVTKMFEYRATGVTEGYQGFWMQDGESALFVYGTSVGENIAIGDEVLVTSTVTVYSGLYETSSVTGLQLITPAAENSAKIAKCESVTVNKDNFNGTDLADKQGWIADVKLIYVAGTMVANTSAGLTFALYDNASVSVSVRCDKYSTDFDDIAAVINALKVGDVVELSVPITWYGTNPQFQLTATTDIEVSTDSITSLQKAEIDLSKASKLVASSFNANSESVLTAKGSIFETAISYELAEGTDAVVTLKDGVLTLGNFKDGFKFTLIAKFAYTEGEETKYLTKEYEVSAVAPITLAEALAASKVEDGISISCSVSDVLGQQATLTDGTNYILVSYADTIVLTAGNKVVVSVKSFAKNAAGIYCAEVTALQDNIAAGAYFLGKGVKVSELTAAFGKYELDTVTIASGEAKVSETVTVKFYSDVTMATAYADGTYTNLEGYLVPVDETTLAYIVTRDFSTVAEALAAATKTVVYIHGVIEVVYSSYKDFYIKDSTGCILVYASTALTDGDTVVITGAMGAYNGTPQVTSTGFAEYLVSEGDWTMSTPTVTTIEEILAFTSATAPFGEYLQLTGKLVKSGNNYNLVMGETTVQLYNSTVPSDLAALAGVDSSVTVNAYFYGNSKADWSTGSFRFIFVGRTGEYTLPSA